MVELHSDRPANVSRNIPSRGFVLVALMAVVGLAHFNRVSMSVAGAEQLIPRGGLTETGMGVVYSAFLWT